MIIMVLIAIMVTVAIMTAAVLVIVVTTVLQRLIPIYIRIEGILALAILISGTMAGLGVIKLL